MDKRAWHCSARNALEVVLPPVHLPCKLGLLSCIWTRPRNFLALCQFRPGQRSNIYFCGCIRLYSMYAPGVLIFQRSPDCKETQMGGEAKMRFENGFLNIKENLIPNKFIAWFQHSFVNTFVVCSSESSDWGFGGEVLWLSTAARLHGGA